MSLRDRIVELISESGVGHTEKVSTIRTTCPLCAREDKFSILKKNGASICYRQSCDFGKRWFEDWVALTFSVSMKQARAMVHGESEAPEHLRLDEKLEFSYGFDQDKPEVDDIDPITYPDFYMTTIDHADSAEGLAYLERRGVTKDMALANDICYSKFYRRVYFPVKMGGIYYGYQGRAIDQVEDSLRVRNNEGFRRELLVMFADNLDGSDVAIIAEGPVDALKFDLVGSNICSMGKAVTDKQLDIIKSYGVSKLYLALDQDAAFEMNELTKDQRFQEFYKLDLPQSCVDRCNAVGKKADFGECTLEEAKFAFDNAKPVGSSLFFHLNDRFK